MYYARLWQRALAALIDVAVISLVTAVVGISMGVNPIGPLVGEADSGFQVLDAVFVLFAWLYFAIMESTRTQGTLGKLVLGIKVTDLETARLSFDRASGRFGGKIVSTLILLIGYVMAAFTARRQALHDKMAGTLVVTR